MHDLRATSRIVAMTVLSRAPDVLEQELDGELLLLRPGHRDVLHLDRVARALWGLLREPLEQSELVAALATAYGVGRQRVEVDVAPALGVLTAHGLVLRAG